MPLCESCRERYGPDGAACETCERRHRYGVIVEVLTSEIDEPPFARWTLDALEALAEFMTDRHRLIREHRRELNDEIREGQRAARASYTDGRIDQARDAESW